MIRTKEIKKEKKETSKKTRRYIRGEDKDVARGPET